MYRASLENKHFPSFNAFLTLFQVHVHSFTWIASILLQPHTRFVYRENKYKLLALLAVAPALTL